MNLFSQIFLISSFSLSYSSLISQNTSSIISSRVTSQATQPYSSLTIARCFLEFLNISSNLSIGRFIGIFITLFRFFNSFNFLFQFHLFFSVNKYLIFTTYSILSIVSIYTGILE